jgi:hypothetical protein
MRRVTVWTTTVVFKDGIVRSYDADSDPKFAPGDIVGHRRRGVRRAWER